MEIVFLLDAGNPVLDSGHSSGLSEALNRVESIHLGMYEDETSRVCRWHLPAAHFLESWGVERDYRGRFCYRQPVILPLYGGISAEEVLSGLLSSKGISPRRTIPPPTSLPFTTERANALNAP